jgi:hypothetical protein
MRGFDVEYTIGGGSCDENKLLVGGVVLHDNCVRDSGCSRSLDCAGGAGGGFVAACGAVAVGSRS